MCNRARGSARAGAAVALLAALLGEAAWAAPGDATLVTRGASGATGGNGASSSAAISAEGRFVAFESSATNLVAEDSATADVYVRDLQTATPGATISRVSVGPFGAGDFASFTPAISAGGRFVAFASDASNLVSGETDGLRDIYVRDRGAGTTTLVSRSTGGANSDDQAIMPAISADGRFVAFASDATNLDPRDLDGVTDIYRRDLQTGITELVSVSTTGTGNNNTASWPSISADGRLVAFESFASNLHADDPDTSSDVFVRDMQTTTTTLVSRAAGATGVKANDRSSFAAISADGRFVAFDSKATNLHPDDTDINPDVLVRDLQEHTVVLASRAPGAAGAKGVYPISDQGSVGPAISADGRRVAFESAAANFPDDGDVLIDVFVRDLQEATTTLVSRAAGTTGANSNSTASDPAIAANGTFVAFGSIATNLDPADTSTIADVFVRELAPPARPEPTPGPTVAPPSQLPATPLQAAPSGPRPVLGTSERLDVLAGTVRFRPRRQRRFVRVRQATLIPDGSEIDTTRGRLRLTVARRDGSTESAEVSMGRAIVDQDRAARPTTTLALSKSLACPRAKRTATAAKAKRTRKRRLFVKTNGGRFRTRGHYAAGRASGTAWRTTETCTTTRIEVRKGTVRVRDLVARRTITLRAPRFYVARRARA